MTIYNEVLFIWTKGILTISLRIYGVGSIIDSYTHKKTPPSWMKVLIPEFQRKGVFICSNYKVSLYLENRFFVYSINNCFFLVSNSS